MIPFTKMQGTGNDYVVVDPDAGVTDFPAFAKAMCDRRLGVGADGVLLVTSDAPEMRMWNPDGSEAEMCGNGIRCAARFIWNVLGSSEELKIKTKAGLKQASLESDASVSIVMGKADFEAASSGIQGTDEFIDQPLKWEGWRGTVVSMGNPHLVIPAKLKEHDLEWFGPIISNDKMFANGINVHFIEVKSRESLQVIHWERGAGPTLSCGTGICACVAAAHRLNAVENDVLVHVPGGEVQVNIAKSGHVTMTGPAEIVFMGTWPS